MNNKYISLRGVRQNNLKNISLDLPRNNLIIITGVSGSGKSSLAFDTIYAEGQRRYIESLSVYARQFLEQMDKPELDSISGIPPAIAIEQKDPPKNSRSTVGTVTEINDYLRLLYAKIGKTFCNGCGRMVEEETIETVEKHILSLPEGTKIFIIFPHIQDETLSWEENLSYLKSKGYTRLMTDKGPVKIDDIGEEIKSKTLKVLLDRIKISSSNRGRFADSLGIAYREGKGNVEIVIKEGSHLKFSKNFECPYCKIEFHKPSPLLFSFNSPYGACPSCHGFGNLMEIDENLDIPDKGKTLRGGAVVPWTTPKGRKFFAKFERAAYIYRIPLDIPYGELTVEHKDILWRGKGSFPGIEGFFDMIEEKKHKIQARVMLSRYRGYSKCPACDGKRLKPESLYVKIKNHDIGEICSMDAGSSLDFFKSLKEYLTPWELATGELILKEIIRRLEYLVNVGLDYITLDRLTKTISSGEYQRIKLAGALGSGLTHTLYVLDEPTIGLHQRDSDRLINILKKLRDIKNTLLVVEHDPEMIKAGDYIVDIGPGPGEGGGEVVFRGTVAELLKSDSITGKYLRGEHSVNMRNRKNEEYDLFSSFMPSLKFINLKGAGEHNLKDIDLSVPLNLMVCITGVSGSGKSTLISDILYPALKRAKGDFSETPGKYTAIEGSEYIEDVILVDQSPIGKSPRSNPVTYIKAFDDIRNIFSRLPISRVKGLKPGDFSFNVPGGRCNKCEGNGYIEVDMQFMSDIYITCEECHGKRYERRILDVTYKEKNIADILSMTVREAMDFFKNIPSITKKLKALQNTGLDYLRLGQAATTLSGGEAQRLKLASHLLKGGEKGNLYIFDEPSTGLHLSDIEKLLLSIKELIKKGNSVILIEHNMEIIKNSDYIIDLGPEGGHRGGEIIAEGTPEDIMRKDKSHTGKYLRKYAMGDP